MFTIRKATTSVALLCVLTLGLTTTLVSPAPAQAVSPSGPAWVSCLQNTGKFDVRLNIEKDANFPGAEQWVAAWMYTWRYTGGKWVPQGWSAPEVQLVGSSSIWPEKRYSVATGGYYYVYMEYAWYSPTIGWYGWQGYFTEEYQEVNQYGMQGTNWYCST